MKDPAFLFYPGDWLCGTMGMPLDVKGAYMELLIFQFNNYHFTEAQAKQVLSICFDVAWPMLKQKFKLEGEFYYNERLRYEIEKRKSFTESRRINGLQVKTHKKNNKASAKHMPKHMENENENINKDLNNKKSKEDIAFEFYKTEADKAKLYDDQQSKDYVEFARHVCVKKDSEYRMKYFLQMDNQLTLDEYHKLRMKTNNAEEIKNMADSIQTKKQYHGKYTDVYKTLNTWLNRK